MRTIILGLPLAASLALPACTPLSPSEPGGALIGAAGGFVTAKALDVDPKWELTATLLGAAAGALVARNADGQQCAYSYGDGSYYTAPCP